MGAAIAAGSHDENGIWALFVIAARIIIAIIVVFIGVLSVCKIDQFLWFSIHPMLRRMVASPIRFVRAVIIPAARDLGFW